ncbi:MAG: B12-binding domain-containing radical SAM protein [Candidatus Omnitrophica bacterium]|nr:B12-binding domain-containing radical SAM protein [Candidatus Omnitrophota bacterium]
MTKVLFIYPNVLKALQEQMGIAYLSAMLKANGIETKLFDYTFEGESDLEEIMYEYDPDFVAVSARSGDFHTGLVLAKICWHAKHNVKILFGGVHPTLEPYKTMSIGFIDAVFIGESDFTLPEYILSKTNGDKLFRQIKGVVFRENGIYKGNVKSTTPDLNKIDELIKYPDHGMFKRHFGKEFYGNAGVLGTIMTSRGCPYNCSFCCNHALKNCYDKSNAWTRFRKIENVINEIEYCIKEYGTTHIYIVDDTFTMNKRHVISFCDEYKKRIYQPHGVHFYCMIRADTVDEEVIGHLAGAGCKIVLLGIESGVERIRNDIYNKKVNNSDIINIVRLAHENGIKVISFNMIGSPTETLEDAEKTLELNLDANVDDAKMTILTAFPHTKLYDDIANKRADFGGCGINNKMPINYYAGTNIINPNMTLEQMLDFQEYFYAAVRGKND